ncbi:MAG TPA: hypothetical protein VMJ92_00885, partial [Candidatus Limnocylindrales bacterium]|nr:hypothetical protein [Candidatus Limnocylindrales bacterium]
MGPLAALAVLTTASLDAQALRLGFGGAVARMGDDIVVAESNNLVGPSTVYLYRQSGDAWAEVQGLVPENWQAEDHFGTALAVAGGLLVVSAPGQDGGRGAVYTYRREGDGLVQDGRIAFDDAAEGARLGVALAADAGTLLVGGEDGSVRAFTRTGGTWEAAGALAGDDVGEEDRFGAALAVQGDVALVGAPGQATGEVAGTGAAYVFERADGTWSEAAKIALRGLEENDAFGSSVALNDADEAFVGAVNLNGNGEVFSFARDPESGEWGLSGRLAAFAPSGQDRFGATILASDEEILVGGERSHGFSGAVYVFERNEDGDITSSRFFSREDGLQGTTFARAFAVAGDIAVVGAPGDDNAAGTALVFARGDDGWRQAAVLASDV